MRHYIYSVICGLVAVAALTACEQEETFQSRVDVGALDCQSLSVDYLNNRHHTRADSGVNVGDFTVKIIKLGEEGVQDQTVDTCKYSELPDIIALPVGEYKVEALYGNNPVQGWEAPYYFGESKQFTIEKDKVTDGIDPIVCKLSNIRVEVSIDATGAALTDASVRVEAGSGTLTYSPSETKSGYFKYVEGSTTLVATFTGSINGVPVERSFDPYTDVKAGNYYKIKFSVKENPTNDNPGSITIGDSSFTIDGTITTKDENIEVDPGDKDITFTNDLRPTTKPGN